MERQRWLFGFVAVGVLVLIAAAISTSDDTPIPAAASGAVTSSTVAPASSAVTPTSTVAEDTFIRITPDSDPASVVADSPEGSWFVFEPGVYRHVSIRPKEGQVFEARPGVVLTGARLLSGFVQDGQRWFVDGQTQQEWQHGQCFDSHPRCGHPEDVFMDGVLQTHVAALDLVGPGSWFFDYDADRIYVGTDPGGRLVETSVTRQAFNSDADAVEIRGFTIEKYANQAQHGVIDSRLDNRADSARGDAWIVESNVIRHNHGTGIVVSDLAVVRDNVITANGQLGITAYGRDVVVEDNEISTNNTAGFDYSWEGGGSKFKRTQGLQLLDNLVRDNFGPGLWTDIDNVDSVIAGNVVLDNAYIGIFHEISYDAVIRDNLVEGNGFHFTVDLWGAGITVAASPNVEVVGNTVRANAGGIVGIQQNRFDAPASFGPVEIENLHVHSNVVEMEQGFTGLRQEVGDGSYYTSRNNRFESNQYVLSQDDPAWFYWNDRPITLGEWESLGLG